MEISPPNSVGSLDDWLAKAPLAASEARQASPFAAVSHGARRLKPAQSMPASRSPDTTIQETDQPLPSLAALLRDVPCCTSPCPQERPARFDEERTMHHGRLRSAACMKSDAQPITRAACHGLGGPSNFLGSAASLPARATQAAVSLESLCTALSSPAAHVTLATAYTRCLYSNEPKIQLPADSAAAAVAVAAAFSRSMTTLPSLPETSSSSSSSLSGASSNGCLFPYIGCWNYDKLAVGTSIDSSGPRSLLPPIGVSNGHRESDTAAAASGGGCGYPGAGSAESGRRGLSEGTVRGGSPRNSWRYCSAPQL
ncbi:hypothetical protein PLESTF_001894800 [Pleodorina starrii]|nr:hypothetical protein PLESTM_000692600 [Pleodorina starrii]GLC77179.1 hypothetical protein PLESTF_001894800 [Pleodorina starrii]